MCPAIVSGIFIGDASVSYWSFFPIPGNSPRSLCESGDLDNSEFSSDVFERRRSTGSGDFALFGRDFEQILGRTVF